MSTPLVRAAAVAGGLAIAAAFVVSCSQTAEKATEKGKEIASSASSIGSSAASAAGSAASSAASVAGSAASSAASAAGSAASSAGSVASSAVSSVLNGTPTTIEAPGVGPVALDGPAAAVYQKAGGAAALGAPTAAPEKLKDADTGGEGTVYAFAGGTIFESPDHGPKLVQGEILKVYAANGGPAGALGWPTADETETGGGPKVAGGGWIGEFENGTITWLNYGNGAFTETVTKK